MGNSLELKASTPGGDRSSHSEHSEFSCHCWVFFFSRNEVPKFNNPNKISKDESATVSRYLQPLFYIIIFVLQPTEENNIVIRSQIVCFLPQEFPVLAEARLTQQT